MGNRQPAREYPTADERFWAKVDKAGPDGCWLWTGSTRTGYGRVNRLGQTWDAHRVSYVTAHGQLPYELHLDHLCRVPNCVNPDHLEPVSQAENMLRGTGWGARHAKRTHCPQGHPYNEANTYIVPSTQGRACRICRSNARAEQKRRAKERRILGLGPGRPGRPQVLHD